MLPSEVGEQVRSGCVWQPDSVLLTWYALCVAEPSWSQSFIGEVELESVVIRLVNFFIVWSEVL